MVAITNDSYINSMRHSILFTIFRVVGIALILICFSILAWANNLVNRIKRIKDKIDNINNDKYNNLKYNTKYYDELYTLDKTVEDMRIYLKEQEEYKNQMYQNISHDFKTPITVMKSYIEAYEDDVYDKKKAIDVIKEQLKKLENKVHSLLYLNKINYIQERRENLNVQYDVSIIIKAAVDKFKVTRPDVDFVLDIDKKSTVFRGSADMWEAIIDNILNNFMRYAKKKVKITVKNNKIILYNDGENIDEKVLNNIFTPYEKGVNGVFGLGLSIVKKTLHFLNYDISIENVKNGVKFIIFERR
jgi:two-component system sensor histidine kinase CssS